MPEPSWSVSRPVWLGLGLGLGAVVYRSSTDLGSNLQIAWQIVSQATAAYSLALVSLYDTLGPNVVEYCINHSDTRIIFAAPAHLPQLLKLSTLR